MLEYKKIMDMDMDMDLDLLCDREALLEVMIKKRRNGCMHGEIKIVMGIN